MVRGVYRLILCARGLAFGALQRRDLRLVVSGFGVERARVRGARRPGDQGPAAARRPTSRRNRAASGQAEAKWMRMRAAFSTTRGADLEQARPEGRELGPGERHPVVDAVLLAPRHGLGPAVVAVSPEGEPGARPVPADAAHQMLEEGVLAAKRLHGDDTPVPELARGKTATGRAWVYVRDNAPFGGADPPAALFHYSRDRSAMITRSSICGASPVSQASIIQRRRRMSPGAVPRYPPGASIRTARSQTAFPGPEAQP